MPTIQLLKAVVKYPALDPKDFGKGPRINVVCTLPNGEEAKLWGNPKDAIAQLKKGQEVPLVYDGRNYKIVSNEAPQPQPAPSTSPSLPSTHSSDYITNLGQAAANYEMALNTAAAMAKRKLGDHEPASFDTIQRIASDLFHASL